MKYLMSVAIVGIVGLSSAVAQDSIHGRRIIGGEPTDIKKHPWQVVFKIKIGNDSYLCSGSSISPTWILTAAHCFYDKGGIQVAKPADVKIKGGVTNYITQGNWLPVESVVTNEAYDAATHNNDISLVKLSRLPAGVDTIPLLDSTSSLENQKLEVTGWGVTESGAPSSELRKVTVPYVDNSTCNAPDSYNGRALPGMICAGERDGGVDACQGDSGGPLVLNRVDGPVLAGVVSSGDGCAQKLKYGLYTRVSAYRAWINRVVLAAQE